MAERYKPYPVYKTTETDWLGEAPLHWKTIPVGRLFKRIKRTNHTDKELLSVYRDHGIIPTSSRGDNNNKPSEDLSPYQLVEPNDLVMNKMKAWQGSIAVSAYEGIVSPAYFVYKPLPKLFDLAYPKYIHYLLRHPMYIAQYLRQSKGIRVHQWDLDPEEFQTIELLLPEKNEQVSIFQFLDHETAKIDTLIEKQQQLIQLLKEKRQAVISHAVTKGLNPNAKMRQSGIEWLGDVPETWTICRIKQVARLESGHTPDKKVDAYWVDCDIPWVSLNDSSQLKEVDYISDTAFYLNEKGIANSSARKLPKGCVVFTRDASIGLAAITTKIMAVSQHIIAWICTEEKVIPEYLLLVFYAMKDELERYTFGATLKTIGMPDVNKLTAAFPEIEEQKQIIDHVFNARKKFDLLIAKAETAINLIKERRTALISAAVTGKIDVRDWVAPQANQIHKEVAV